MNWKSYFFEVFKPNDKDIQGLNGIRAIAYFMLMYAHMYLLYDYFGFKDNSPILANILINGSLCMDAFFMLSGFLIGGQLFYEYKKTNNINYGRFFVKRLLRIFPPYYIFLIFQYFSLNAILKTAKEEEIIKGIQELLPRIKWDFLYMTDYIGGTFTHGWSLSIEEKFYVLLPLMLIAMKNIKSYNFKLIFIFILSILPIFFRYYTYSIVFNESIDLSIYKKFFYYPFHSRMDALFMGVFFAGLYTYYPDKIKNYLNSIYSKVLVILAVVFLIFIFAFTNERDLSYFTCVFRFWIVSLLWAILLIGCLDETSLTSKILSLRIFNPVAKLSYCAYIIHMLFMGILCNKLIGYGQIYHYEVFIWFIPVGVIILGIAYIYYLVAEKPFLTLRKKLLK